MSSSGAYTVGFSKAVLAAHDAARHDVASGDLRPERQVYHDTFKSCGLLDTQLFCEANLGLYKVKPTFLPLLQKKLARRQKALKKRKSQQSGARENLWWHQLQFLRCCANKADALVRRTLKLQLFDCGWSQKHK